MIPPTGSPALGAVRLAESTVESLLVVTLVLTPSRVFAVDRRTVAILAAVLVVLTAAAYAFHRLTFDQFRIIGGRPAPTVEQPDRWPSGGRAAPSVGVVRTNRIEVGPRPGGIQEVSAGQ